MDRPRPPRLLLPGLLALLLASAAAAAALPPLDPPDTGAHAPGDAAVIIGLETYTDLSPVPYARRDAQAFHQLLRRTVGVPAERVSLLDDRSGAREAMEREVQRMAGLARDTLWIYFSGHGATAPGPAGNDALLLGRDATAATLAERGLRQADLLRWAEDSRARRVVIILDACFTGKDRAGASLTGARFAAPPDLSLPPRIVLWTAAGADQVAGPLVEAGHGRFSYLVISALSGSAADGGDQVTLGAAAAQVDAGLTLLRNLSQQFQTAQLSAPPGAARWVLTRAPRRPPPPLESLAWPSPTPALPQDRLGPGRSPLGGPLQPIDAPLAPLTPDPMIRDLGGLMAEAEAAEREAQDLFDALPRLSPWGRPLGFEAARERFDAARERFEARQRHSPFSAPPLDLEDAP